MQLYLRTLTEQDFNDLSVDELDMLLVSSDGPPVRNEIIAKCKTGITNNCGATVSPGVFIIRGINHEAESLNRLWDRMNHPTYYDGDES